MSGEIKSKIETLRELHEILIDDGRYQSARDIFDRFVAALEKCIEQRNEAYINVYVETLIPDDNAKLLQILNGEKESNGKRRYKCFAQPYFKQVKRI